ncbi:MAG TPA: 4-alpha-glucanotransferase, partial [Dissulfurispiraceae bacterium]
MQSYEELIHELSEMYGIVPEYWDVFGARHVTSVETKKAILRAMGLKVDSAEDAAREIGRQRCKPWCEFVEPVKTVSVSDRPWRIPVYIPVREGDERRLSLSWSIRDEEGRKSEFVLAGDAMVISDQHWIDGVRYIKVELTDTVEREIGYYFLDIACRYQGNVFPDGTDMLRKSSRLIVAPDTCYLPSGLEEGKTWGLYVNLYSIRSPRNWGIGDFTDLKELIGLVAGRKGGFVGINPLHAIPNKKPYGISPYSPISRHYKNFIYLDMDSVPEVRESAEAQVVLKSKIFREQIEELANGATIDYKKIAFLKKS